MNKSAEREDGRKAASGQLWLDLAGMVHEALYDTVIGAGLACVDEVLEAERVALCGARYEHQADRQALRAGHVASSLVLGGRRVAVQRPRARSVAGGELRLPSWREWSARDPLEQRAVEQMVLGVSPRGYARSLEPLPEAVAVRGISKSAVASGSSGDSARERRDAVKRLETVPGVGPIVALTAIAVFAEVSRFESAKHAASYAGLVPSTFQSGECDAHGHITKCGSAELRAMLCEAAHHARRSAHPLHPHSPGSARGAVTRPR